MKHRAFANVSITKCEREDFIMENCEKAGNYHNNSERRNFTKIISSFEYTVSLPVSNLIAVASERFDNSIIYST